MLHYEELTQSTYGRNIADNKKLRQKLRAKCEDLKICLSSSMHDRCTLCLIYHKIVICFSLYLGDLFADIENDLEMTAEAFSDICEPHFQKTIDISKNTLAEAKIFGNF